MKVDGVSLDARVDEKIDTSSVAVVGYTKVTVDEATVVKKSQTHKISMDKKIVDADKSIVRSVIEKEVKASMSKCLTLSCPRLSFIFKASVMWSYDTFERK